PPATRCNSSLAYYTFVIQPPATPGLYTLSLHDALPISGVFGRPNYSGLPFNGEDGNNPNLKPATSVSRSIGVVFKPHFVPGLSADRKSTRLNSSHVAISYAVFCLKKKISNFLYQ